MNAMEILAEAQKMYSAQGSQAIAAAARKAQEFDKAGDKNQARDWKRIKAALMQLRGPNAS